MASLRLAMDAAFWDLGVSTARTLDGTAKSVPGEPAPLDGARVSKAMRPQQLSLFRYCFPLGIIPALSPAASQKYGLFSLQTLIPGPSLSRRWWSGFILQFRPKTLISDIREELESADEIDLNAFKDSAKRVLEKPRYDLGFFSGFNLTSKTSLMFNVEGYGDRNECRTKAAIIHQLANHDITIEAASPELFIDRKGTYWNLPLSLSFDVASYVQSGLRYHFGMHKNTGYPHALNSSSGDAPLALLPGVCAKAAFSYENKVDFWRKHTKVPRVVDVDNASSGPYDYCLKDPHSALSGIIGGSCAAWFGGDKNLGASADLTSGETQVANTSERKRSPFSADAFGSLCYTYQHGKFIDAHNDLTRLDARLDIPSATSFLKGANNLICNVLRKPVERRFDPLSSPRLSLIMQQQVAGPFVFRVDTRFSFNSPSGYGPHVDDTLLGLSYSLRRFESGKILAWYSPKRKEFMVEFRVLEFNL